MNFRHLPVMLRVLLVTTVCGVAIDADLLMADDAVSSEARTIVRESRTVVGWQVHIDRRLLLTEPETTSKALKLLEKQLREIKREVPAAAVQELQRVPLYFSPEYPGAGSRAEFHPGKQWLIDNGRDPVMEKAVEFSNILNFEAEMVRMPNFALHELAHAYHNLVLSEGFGNPQLIKAFEHAKTSGTYDRVERRHGVSGRQTVERAYGMNSPMEYFAETTEAFFSQNDFFPFNKNELKQHDPQMYALLQELWGVLP